MTTHKRDAVTERLRERHKDRKRERAHRHRHKGMFIKILWSWPQGLTWGSGPPCGLESAVTQSSLWYSPQFHTDPFSYYFMAWELSSALSEEPHWGLWDPFQQQHTMRPSLSDKARNPSLCNLLPCSSQTKVKSHFEMNSAGHMRPPPPHLPWLGWSSFRLVVGLRSSWAPGQSPWVWLAPGERRTPSRPWKEKPRGKQQYHNLLQSGVGPTRAGVVRLTPRSQSQTQCLALRGRTVNKY